MIGKKVKVIPNFPNDTRFNPDKEYEIIAIDDLKSADGIEPFKVYGKAYLLKADDDNEHWINSNFCTEI
jgi:hypothetical protein